MERPFAALSARESCARSCAILAKLRPDADELAA